MIVTKQFVMLNFPKTGSSYARKIIKKLYSNRVSGLERLFVRLGIMGPRLMELRMPKIDEERSYGIVDQHGTLRQIPRQHGDKTVVSIARNPFYRYVSNYLYRWWARYPSADEGLIRESFPSFPDLTFEEYYDMTHMFSRANRLREIEPKVDLGIHTIQFIQFYFRNPEKVLREIDEAYIEEGCFREEMGEVTFLRQENLEKELREFLLQMGATRLELIFMGSMERVNVTKKTKEEQDYKKFLTNGNLVEKILQRDKLLFKLFPEYLIESFAT